MKRLLGILLAGALPGMSAVEFDAIYGDGMVLQRGQKIVVRGKTDRPGEPVTVSFNGQTVKAMVKGTRWMAGLQPMEANATGQELVASQESGSATVRNVVVGEVWIASGQSNMLWRLNQTPGGGQADIAQSSNEQLRFHHSEPMANPNPAPYSAEQIKRVTEKRLFEGRWAVSSPATSPRMSAVGYYFGQALQRELKVPVGIIHASLGGSEMLAWIPRDRVNREFPCCRGAGWLESKYAGPWVRGRAKFNMGKADPTLHPYAPAYLYETGIKPWERFPVAGVIWYQGESDAEVYDNAQNKKLLMTLIESWREKLGNDELPFLQVQLPRINDKRPLRAHWPDFRQVQAEVAEEMPAVGCVVTLDLGSTNADVHPPRKVEVGERLAATALSMVYGRDIVACGPEISRVRAWGGKLEVSFRNAAGLRTTDGAAPACFEIAGADKKFRPAAGIIRGEKVILSAEGVRAPRYVRYGWATFVSPNLVNAAGLPAAPCSTADARAKRS